MLVPSELELAPPTRLAIQYTAPEHRAAFRLLMLIDQRLNDVVAKVREPLIGQIKLAWWREGLASAAADRPKGEPLFEALNACGQAISPAALEGLVSAWEALIDADEWTQDILLKHSGLRSAAIFGTYAEWVRSPTDMLGIGQAWASVSLGQAYPGRISPRDIPNRPAMPSERRVRPLTILALSVYENSGPRIIWHALTGR